MNGELPEGWELVPLVAVLEPGGLFDGPFGSSLKTSDYTVSGVRVIRLENIQNLQFIPDKQTFISPAKYAELNKHTVGEGDLLVGSFIDGAIRVCILPPLDTLAIAKADCFCVRLRKDLVDPRYIAYQLGTARTHAALIEEIHGATRPRITTKQLRSFQMRLCSVPEQRRIVAALERILERVNAARERLNHVPSTLKRFRQAVLASACSGRLTADWREQNSTSAKGRKSSTPPPLDSLNLPASWGFTLSQDAFNFVTSGSRGWAKYYANEGATFIRVGNLDRDSITLDLSSIQRVKPPTGPEGSRTRIQPGDILITITAEPGMIALVEGDIGEAYVNQHVALARPTGNLNPRYLAYFLAAHNGGQEQFAALQRGATKAGLGLDDIRSIQIAHPPLPEQVEIVKRIETLFALAAQIEAKLAAARRRVEGLTQAVLAKAFRGELVPTEAELTRREGLDHEPAAALLERIRAEREQNGPPKRGRRRQV